MGSKEAAKRASEAHVLEHLRTRSGDAAVWEIAMEMGWPWQQVAKVLKRLAAQRCILVRETTRKDAHYRVRLIRKYRPAGTLERMPAWLDPQPQPVTGARLVTFGRRGAR